MWTGVVYVILFVPACSDDGFFYQYDEEEGVEEKNTDFYDTTYDNSDVTMPVLTTTGVDVHTRIRRYGSPEERRTLNQQEIREVRGALKDILSNQKVVTWSPIEFAKSSPVYEYFEKFSDPGNLSTHQIKEIKGVLKDMLSNQKVGTWSPVDPANNSPMYEYFEKFSDHRQSPDDGGKAKGALKDMLSNQKAVTWSRLDPAQNSPIYEYFEKSSVHKANNLQDLTQAKDALGDMLSNQKVATWSHLDPAKSSPIYEYVEKSSVHKPVNPEEGLRQATVPPPNDALANKKVASWSPIDAPKSSPMYEYFENTSDPRFLYPQEVKKASPQDVRTGSKIMTWSVVDVTQPALKMYEYVDMSPTQESDQNHTDSGLDIYVGSSAEDKNISSSDAVFHKARDWVTVDSKTVGIRDRFRARPGKKTTKKVENLADDWPFDTTTAMIETTSTKHRCPTLRPITTPAPTTTTVRPTLRLDVEGLLELIANLTYEYDMNLTERFNETLIKYSVPTCPTPTTTATPTTTPPEYNFANTSIVGKCFVCGLENLEIPEDAYCADAFAGDFLPLVPVDPRARGKIAKYRKYCRFLDVRNYMENPEEPRAVYGRFTGGCSVRWTDLTGVYTQRTCRNKRRAVMGKHFASKRMAKLEMALNHLDNGCIVSPMATLLPLSRGISLYARFHACVCTGAWCNRSPRTGPWPLNTLLLFWLLKFR